LRSLELAPAILRNHDAPVLPLLPLEGSNPNW
jgi:hypothetical protein